MLWIAVLLLTVSCSAAETVNRINYGVLFESQGSVCAVYDFWTHTFQVPFPDLKQSRLDRKADRNMSCEAIAPKHVAACKVMEKALESVNDVRNQYVRNLKYSLKLAKKVMPKESGNVTSRSRSKRALLPFIGDISRSLFGTATEKEVRQMARHIDLLQKKNERMTSAFAQYADDLSSYMTLADKRHSNIRATLDDNRQAISTLAQDFEAMTSSMNHNLQFSVLLNKEIYLAMSMQEALQEFLHGIHSLLQHTLSPYIVPFKDVKSTVVQIDSRLKLARSQLTVKDQTPCEFYSSENFIWTFKNGSLFITVKFPLVSPVSHLDLYKVYTIPVPFNETSSHSTQLLDLPPYIAFTRDRHFYTFPSANIWQQGILNAQEYNLPMFPVHEETCTTSLFFDNRKAIKENCDFRVKFNVMKPTMTHLNQGQYLVSNISDLFLRCPSGLRQQDGCSFCIINVPCLCDVSSDSMYYPPRLNHCLNEDDKPTTIHPVNLAVLMHVVEEYQIENIYGDTTFEDIPTSHTPAVQLFKHNLSDIIAADKETDLSLKRIADAIRHDKLVFQTLADPILDQLQVYEESSFSWTSVVTIADTVLIGLLFCIAAFFGVKLYSVTQILAALSSVKPAEAKSYFYLRPPTTTTTLPTTTIIIKEQDHTVMFVILSISLITLAVSLYKYVTRVTRHASINLEISNGTSCVLVPLQKIPFCPKFYHLCTNENFGKFKVQGTLQPLFTWSKQSLKVTNMIDGSELAIPEQVPISIYKARKINRILHSDQVFAYIVAVHGMHAFHLKMCPTECNKCVVEMNVVEKPAVADENERLYPKLE